MCQPTNVLKPQNEILFVQRLMLEYRLIVSHLTKKKTLVTKGHIYNALRMKCSEYVNTQRKQTDS